MNRSVCLFGSIQLSSQTDGTAVLLLSDGVHQRQAILGAQGLRLQQAGRVVGQVP